MPHETVGASNILIPESIDYDVLWVPMTYPHSVWLVLAQLLYHHHEQMKQWIAGQPSNHFLNPSDLCRLLLRKEEFHYSYISKTLTSISMPGWCHSTALCDCTCSLLLCKISFLQVIFANIYERYCARLCTTWRALKVISAKICDTVKSHFKKHHNKMQTYSPHLVLKCQLGWQTLSL